MEATNSKIWGTTYDISGILQCLLDALVFENRVYQYIGFAKFIECISSLGSGTGGDPGDPSGSNCDRDSRNNKDYYEGSKLNAENALESVEGWWGGDIEMRFVVAMVSGTNGNTNKVEKTFSDEREEFYNSCGW